VVLAGRHAEIRTAACHEGNLVTAWANEPAPTCHLEAVANGLSVRRVKAAKSGQHDGY
jgi:hypothetical protein